MLIQIYELIHSMQLNYNKKDYFNYFFLYIYIFSNQNILFGLKQLYIKYIRFKKGVTELI